MNKFLNRQREYFKRQKYLKYELLFYFAKGIFLDLRVPIIIRFFFFKFYISLYQYSYVKFSRYCLYSLKKNSILFFFRLNRLIIKKFISYGFWAGIRKSSW